MSDIKIVGYVEIDGVKTFSDKVMRSIWDQLVDDGTAGIVFERTTINDADQFLAFIKQPMVLPAIIMVDNQISGFGWLDNMSKNFAFANYGFFKAVWGRRTIDMGKALTDYWFTFESSDGGHLIDVLIGQTPGWNQKAVKFLSRIGWNIIGRIPFIADGEDMVISYAVRSE